VRKGVRGEVSREMVRQAASGVRGASARVTAEYQSICYHVRPILVKINYYIVKNKGFKGKRIEKVKRKSEKMWKG